ncbi:alpha/beta hydrolase [Aneurinibacillus terranovensis]|uniref:alpha/beta hydrolase n=1 Tax=Aneurinibacillus terranovensis TaxID=278991 RepID=UPI0004095149|nr:alpha/beta hydrolase [Aneurinibacillus terranovensis]
MKIFQEVWPTAEARGTVVIVHGAGEYFARYHWLARELNQAGYSVIGGDLPGLGRSGGKRGHIQRFEDYYKALDQWLQTAFQGKRPLFLLGHSMGGLIVIRYMQEKKPDVEGVILSSPCLELARNIHPVLAAVASLFDVCLPSLTLSAGIAAGDVSRDRTIAERYGNDSYITKRVSVRWYKQLVRAMRFARLQQNEYPGVRTLIMQAGADRIVNAAATRKWSQALPISDKQYWEWEGLYHEIFNEPEKEEIARFMLDWMDQIKHRQH